MGKVDDIQGDVLVVPPCYLQKINRGSFQYLVEEGAMRKRLFTILVLLLCACSREPEGLNDKDCDDGKDNDLDGRYDCDDDGCSASTTCVNLARKSLEKSPDSPKKTAHAPVSQGAVEGSTFVLNGLEVQRHDNGTDLPWEGADKYCSKLALTDKSDWRLPTEEEAVKIIESGKLANEPSYVMWTSTRKGGNRAVIVGISGAINTISTRSKGQCRARCVRGSIAN